MEASPSQTTESKASHASSKESKSLNISWGSGTLGDGSRAMSPELRDDKPRKIRTLKEFENKMKGLFAKHKEGEPFELVFAGFEGKDPTEQLSILDECIERCSKNQDNLIEFRNGGGYEKIQSFFAQSKSDKTEENPDLYPLGFQLLKILLFSTPEGFNPDAFKTFVNIFWASSNLEIIMGSLLYIRQVVEVGQGRSQTLANQMQLGERLILKWLWIVQSGSLKSTKDADSPSSKELSSQLLNCHVRDVTEKERKKLTDQVILYFSNRLEEGNFDMKPFIILAREFQESVKTSNQATEDQIEVLYLNLQIHRSLMKFISVNRSVFEHTINEDQLKKYLEILIKGCTDLLVYTPKNQLEQIVVLPMGILDECLKILLNNTEASKTSMTYINLKDAVQSAVTEYGVVGLSSFFQIILELQVSAETKVRLTAACYSVAQGIGHTDLNQANVKQINVHLVESLNKLLQENDRSVSLGNLISKFYLERAARTPLALIDNRTLLSQEYYLAQFFKTFDAYILNETSFTSLKPLAKLVSKKENYQFFTSNYGIEFIYCTIMANPVFIDDVIPSKGFIMLLDSLLYNAKPEDIKYMYLLFFNGEFQDKVGYYANFLSDVVSLTLVYMKLNLNLDLMPTISQNKLYLNILSVLKDESFISFRAEAHDSFFRLVLMLIKFELCTFRWHIDNKRQGDYKKRLVVLHTLVSVIPQKCVPLWFFDELFQFLIWNGKHLGRLYPYNRSNVPTSMGEGPNAEVVSKYSAENRDSISFNPELLEPFLSIAFSQEAPSSRSYIMKKFLDALPDETGSEILINKDFFWTLSRLKMKTYPDKSLENFLSAHLADYLVKMIILELQKDKDQCQSLKIFLTDLESEESAIFLFRKLLAHLLEFPVLSGGKQTKNFLRNFAKLVLNRHAILPWSLEIDSAILEAITRLTFKNNVEIRQAMMDAKLFELRDLMLVNIIRLIDDEESIVKLLTQFSFEAICNSSSFRESFALANLVKVLVKTKNEDLQIFVLKLFKFELTNEDSQKEVARLLGDVQTINFLFPGLKNKLLTLPCFSSGQLKDKELEFSPDPTRNVEIFLKIFNTDSFSDMKKKADLTCQASLLEMQKTARASRAKATEKLASSKAKVREQIREREVTLDLEKNQMLVELLNESMKAQEKSKKKIEAYHTLINTKA